MPLRFLVLFLSASSVLAKAEFDCPDGSLLQGASPPQGYEQFCALADGTRHGPYKHWYGNGQLLEWLHFKKGKEHGQQTAWWPNGQMMMRGQSINGKRYKTFEYWDVLGRPRQLEVEVITEQH